MTDTPRPAPVLLDEVDGIRLYHWPGDGPAGLAVFAPGREAPAAPRDWWGYPIAARLGWTTLAFATSRQTWYPRAAMARLLPRALRAIGGAPVVTYGFSMGGYAALKYGRALGARGTLALSPQYSIDPAEVPGDPRAAHFFDSRLHAGMAVRAEDVADLVFYAYDPLESQDRHHADRLAQMQGLRPIRLRRAGHATPAVLAEAHSAPAILAALAAGDAAAALAGMRRARHESPSLLTALALTLELRGHPGSAARIRARLPERAARTERSLDARARVLHQLGRYNEELVLLKAWIADQPRSLEAHLRHATCCLALDQPAAAVTAIEGAMAVGRVDQRLHAALVSSLRRLERTEAAIAAAHTAVRAEPGLVSAHVQLGDTLLWAQHRAAARAAFEAALALDPDHAAARLGAAIAEAPGVNGPGPLLSGHIAALVEARAPEEEWLALAERLASAQRVPALMLALRHGIAVRPESASLRLRLGHALVAAERLDEAVEAFRALARHAPGMQDGWLGAADLLWRLRRLEDGLAVLGAAVAEHPAHAGLAIRHATFLNASGDPVAAEREGRRALALSQDDENALLTVADALWRQHRAGDAASLVEEACARRPDSMALAVRLGQLRLALQLPGDAVAAFERAVAGGSAPVHAWLGLADALRQAGQPQAAAEAARRGLREHPDSAELRAAMGHVLPVSGDAGTAPPKAATAAPDGAPPAGTASRQPSRGRAFPLRPNLL